MPGSIRAAGRVPAEATGRLVVAAGALGVSILLPPADGAASRAPGLDPADLAARGGDSLALVVLACLLLVWRRQWPVGVWMGILALAAADTVVTDLPSRCLGALMVSVYTVAVRTDRRTTLVVAAATAVTLIIPMLLFTALTPSDTLLNPGAGAAVFAGWVVVAIGGAALALTRRDA